MWGHSPCVLGDDVGVGGIAGGGGVIMIPLEALVGMGIGVDLASTMAIDMGDGGIDISTSSLADSTPEESLLVAAAIAWSQSDCVPRCQ